MGGAFSCMGSCSCKKGDFEMRANYDIKRGKLAEKKINDEIEVVEDKESGQEKKTEQPEK